MSNLILPFLYILNKVLTEATKIGHNSTNLLSNQIWKCKCIRLQTYWSGKKNTWLKLSQRIDNFISNFSLYASSRPRLNFGCYFTFEVTFYVSFKTRDFFLFYKNGKIRQFFVISCEKFWMAGFECFIKLKKYSSSSIYLPDSLLMKKNEKSKKPRPPSI